VIRRLCVAGAGSEERAYIPPASYPNFFYKKSNSGLKVIFAVLKSSHQFYAIYFNIKIPLYVAQL
jgi:hypothetical protein